MASHLYLLDGMALAYRAYFALIRSPISTSKGVNTSAIYGFVQVLLEMRGGDATHLAVALDTSAPTARHTRFPAYKAQREAMPEDLAAALPAIERFAAAFHIPILKLDGYEADDIIGTLAKSAANNGFSVTMVTPDKDFGQLVTQQIRMLRPGRMGNPPEILGPDEVCARWGIQRVDQVRDLLGLMGDASDNIPGVPGTGEKTAAKLISQFDSVEALLEGTAALKGRQKELIEQNAEQALLSKELATIDCQTPISVNWEDLAIRVPDEDSLRALCVEFEFSTIGRKLFGDSFKSGRGFAPTTTGDAQGDLFAAEEIAEPQEAATLKTLADVTHRYRAITDLPALRECVQRLSKETAFCFDLETDGLDVISTGIVGVAFCSKVGEADFAIIPAGQEREWLAEMEPLFSAQGIRKIGHNLKFDLSVLRWHGITVTGPFFDTMLAHALIAPDKRHGMDTLAEQYLGYTPVPISRLIGEKGDLSMRAVPQGELVDYACEDADVTLQLLETFEPLLRKHGLERVFHEVESPLLPVLVEMEHHGVAIDSAALAEISISLGKEIHQLEHAIYQYADGPFNLNSPKQLGEILFDRLQLIEKPKKTKTGQYVTNEQVLETLSSHHPIVNKVLEYREAQKLRSTYVDALPNSIAPRTGRIHTTYSQAVTATGRLASTNPNLQNIPIRSERGREIRRAFVPAEGFLLFSADYSQIELRIMAALSGDRALKAAFVSGSDIHTATAAKIHGVSEADVNGEMRRRAKMVNFGIIYGISAFGLAQRLAIPRGEAAAMIDAYFAEYPGVRRFMNSTIAEAQQSGYVETLTGRRRYVPDIRSSNQSVRGGAERMAINTPIQGTAADLIKLAMIRVDGMLRERVCKTRMLLQVHDELVFEMPEDELANIAPEICSLMENALPMDVPVVVETGFGKNWLDAH